VILDFRLGILDFSPESRNAIQSKIRNRQSKIGHGSRHPYPLFLYSRLVHREFSERGGLAAAAREAFAGERLDRHVSGVAAGFVESSIALPALQ
jgi:hypothetical protein